MPNKEFLNQIMQAISSGEKMNKTTVEKMALQYGIKDQNTVKELTELAIVMLARKLAHAPNKTVYERYETIVDLYTKKDIEDTANEIADESQDMN